MKERPILFSAPMVKALLSGNKTQTRRAIRPQPWASTNEAFQGADGIWRFSSPTARGPVSHASDDVRCPYGHAGDRLWVRETWLKTNPFTEGGMHTYGYRASDEIEFPDAIWKPSIHMPRGASRITLSVISVHVERLQTISRGDAMAEGCPFPNMAQGTDPRKWYAELWEAINGPDSWNANPWVWAIEFRVVKQS